MSREAALRDWLAEIAPALADAPLACVRAERGRETWTLGERHLVRRSASDEARRRAGLERWILGQIRSRISLSVPEPVAHDAARGLDLLVRTPGAPLDSETFAALGPARHAQVARAAGQLLAELHGALSVANARAHGARPPAFPPPIDRIVDRLEAEPALAPLHGFARSLEPVLFELAAAPCREAVLHGDLSHHNLAFDAEGHVVGVFDFGAASVGDLHRDLRYAFSFGAFGRRTLDRYADLAGIPVSEPRVRAWHAWSALAFLALDLDTDRLPVRLAWARSVAAADLSWIPALRRELREGR